MQLTLQRALLNFDLWYGGVPRLVLEGPAQQPDESLDKDEALQAIEDTGIEQVQYVKACVLLHSMGSVMWCDGVGCMAPTTVTAPSLSC